MALILVGLFSWGMTLALLGRLLHTSCREERPGRTEGIVWGLLLIVATLLLFRPHEDIYGGQDPGAYLNAAASYAREGRLTFVDPMLSQVRLDRRHLFLYGGRQKFRWTKAACLWINDLESAEVGPWFQPAYSVMMGLLTHVAPTSVILYVTPFFALLTGLALAALAQRLFRSRWAGPVAFALYVANVNTVWHGRCARPEFVASFFVLGAWALLLDSAERHPSRRLYVTLAIASVALAAAPLFHITAWFVVIPIVAWTGLQILRGRTAPALCIPVILNGLAVSLEQFLHVTDCYRIARALQRAALPPHQIFLALSLTVAALYLLALVASRRFTTSAARPGADPGPWTTVPAMAIAFAVPALFTLGHLVQAGATPVLPGAAAFVGRIRWTDVSRAVALLSWPIIVLSVAGWGVMLMSRDRRLQHRLATAAVLLPGILLLGDMPHLMYFSRRLQPFMIPVLVLCLTALVTTAADLYPRGRRVLVPIAVAMILLLGIRNRTHLYTLTEHRGFTRGLGNIAAEIRKHDGILLCEYSRLSAPFDHFFGIPTLGIDHSRWQHRYLRIANRWIAIMRGNPDRPTYFLTPFGTRLPKTLNQTPVKTFVIEGRKLQGGPDIPTVIRPYRLELELYRTTPRGRHGLAIEDETTAQGH